MSMAQIGSLLHEDVLIGLMEIGNELVCQVVRGGVHFRRVFVKCKLSVGYVNGVRYIKKVLELRPCKFRAEQATSRPRALEVQLYLHILMFLEQSMRTGLMSPVPHNNSCMPLG